mgnify:CR=1 FL=1
MLFRSLKPGACLPQKVATTKVLPAKWVPEAQKIIEKMVKDGVLVKVKPGQPTKCLFKAFFVPKSHGSDGLLLVTDMSRLNNIIERPYHPFDSVADTLKQINSNTKYMIVADLASAYYNVDIDEESSMLLAILLPSCLG